MRHASLIGEFDASTHGAFQEHDPEFAAVLGPGPRLVRVVETESGRLSVVADSFNKPNGLAFSPDERYLYVGNWDPERKVVMRYQVDRSGAVSDGTVLFDMTGADGEDAIDGLKVDQAGNLYVCGPGGIWVLSADGEHLGTLRLPENPHNLAWGDDDARTLYVTAMTSVYRLRLNLPGIRPQ